MLFMRAPRGRWVFLGRAGGSGAACCVTAWRRLRIVFLRVTLGTRAATAGPGVGGLGLSLAAEVLSHPRWQTAQQPRGQTGLPEAGVF